jgi:hypothetical protein
MMTDAQITQRDVQRGASDDAGLSAEPDGGLNMDGAVNAADTDWAPMAIGRPGIELVRAISQPHLHLPL